MRKSWIYFFIFSLFISLSLASCSKKTGCPMNDPANVGASTNKKGQLSTKRGNSNLFPKNMRKKKKKN